VYSTHDRDQQNAQAFALHRVLTPIMDEADCTVSFGELPDGGANHLNLEEFWPEDSPVRKLPTQ
jgi:hypothetical protein